MLSRTFLWGGGLPRHIRIHSPSLVLFLNQQNVYYKMQRQKLGVERNPAQRVLWPEQSDGDK
jgi:hypothetical protein